MDSDWLDAIALSICKKRFNGHLILVSDMFCIVTISLTKLFPSCKNFRCLYNPYLFVCLAIRPFIFKAY